MNSEPLPDDPAKAQLRQACSALSEQLRAGQPCRAEQFFAEYPALASRPEYALELIYTEYMIREELGESPEPSEWLTRFPQWRDRLERLIRANELLRPDAEEHLTPAEEEATRATLTVPEPWEAQAWQDSFEVLERIGRGGMGVVYKARQAGLNRLVALKTLRPGDDATADQVRRFRVEAENMARLNHPNIVQVYAVGDRAGRPFFVMEFVSGGNLARCINGKPQVPRQAAAWVESLARAVHYAHQHGILHRDLKPSNVVLTQDGDLKLTDFGLSKDLENPSGQTRTGAVMGTPGYIAPEQARGRLHEVGPPADVYALGAILYEALTGRPPHRGEHGEDVRAILERCLREDPVPPRAANAAIPPELEAICLKCLARPLAERYRSAEAVADDLRRWLDHQPTVAQPARWYTPFARFGKRFGAVAALLFVTVGAVVGVNHLRDPKARALEHILRELDAGRPTTLLRAQGPPDWYRLLTPESDVRMWEQDGVFSVVTNTFCLLELFPDTHGPRYRVSAEVRHDSAARVAGDQADVGIYFGHYQGAAPDREEPVTYLGALTFDRFNRTLWQREPNAARTPEHMVRLSLNCYPTNPGSVYPTGLVVARETNLVGGAPLLRDEWYLLHAEIGPEGWEAAWREPDGQWHRLRGLTPEDLDVRMRSMFRPQPVHAPRPPGRGGVGLYLRHAGASFRNVLVEPVRRNP